MKLIALVFFVAVATVSAGWHGGAHIVPASAGGYVHAGVVPGAVVVGAGGPWGGFGAWGGYGFGGPWGAGSGLEGQYIPDGTEHLYDDGSYRPEHHYAGHW